MLSQRNTKFDGFPNLDLEAACLAQGYTRIAGVDEAGRGPLAGPVVAAAVILPPGWRPKARVEDSKRMNPAERELAFGEIRQQALAWRIAVVDHHHIDRLNILQATLLAMSQAVNRLTPAANIVLIDGNRAPLLSVPHQTVVGGDATCLSIAAASVLAKVARDRIMQVYARRYPHWGFAQHKGYPTQAHRRAIAQAGLSPIHRRSFAVKPLPNG